MALYYFQCSECKEAQRKILTPEEAKKEWACGKCGGKLERTEKPPTTRITETLDNGAMTRKLERLANATEVYAEWTGKKKGAI